MVKTKKSRATVRRTGLTKLNWGAAAVRNARILLSKGAYRKDPDTARVRATYELRDAVGLYLQLVEDPEVHGPMELGRRFVEVRSEEIRLSMARTGKETTRKR